MKKFLLMAVAALGLLFTACSKDEVAQSVAEKSTVTFSVATPELSTRAHGDGESATALAYAVYNRADKALLFQGTKTMSNLTATVEIPFVNGMTYDVLFWAAAPESPYTVDWDAQTVGYTNAAALVGNSEKYDAFYYFLTGDELPEITGPVTKTVELKRPFAQLNIKTNDAKEAAQSGVEVKNVKVVVKNGYSSFDLAAGAGKDKNDVTFDFAAKQENANAEGVQLLAVNYLFTGGEKSLVDVEFTYTDVNGKVAAAGEVMEFASVPVQRNYRTNIVGSLLTSDGKFNIETKPGFDGTHDHSVAVATPEDINALIRKPEVTTVELGAGVYNIDLYNLDKKRTLTINGTDGTQIKFEKLQVRASQFDELVINNCEILRMPDKSWGHLVFGSSDNAEGVYTISNCTFNGVGSQGIYINEETSGATYNVLNCTFNGDFGGEGAVTIQNNDGVDHIVNVLDCTFKNIPDSSHNIFIHYDYNGFTLNTNAHVATAAELQDAINKAVGNTTILFEQDIDADATRASLVSLKIAQKEGVNIVIDGCDHKFEGNILVDGSGRSTGKETLTFKDIHFYTESTTKFTFIEAPSKIGTRYNYSHNVTIEGCKFEFVGDGTVTEIGSASFTGTYNFVMSDCEAINMHSLLQVQSCDNTAKVSDVKVTGCKNGISFGNTAYPTITNATIDTRAYGVRADGNASRGNLVINNSTITANQPIVVRKVTTDGYSVALNNVTLNTEALYGVVFTSGSDDEAYVAPSVQYSVTGADAYNVFPAEAGKPMTAASSEQIAAAIAAGATEINLLAGTYTLPNVAGKTLTLVGAGAVEDVIVNVQPTGSQDLMGATLSFEGVTIQGAKTNYQGYYHTSACNFTECVIKDLMFLYSPTKFEKCTFDSTAEHCIWTYGAEEVDFVNCEFNYSDRGVNVYVDNGANAPGITSDVAFTNCVFNTTNASSKGAVEINSSPFTAGVTVALTNCTAPDHGEIAFISGWDSVNGAKATVTINGVVTTVPQLAK